MGHGQELVLGGGGDLDDVGPDGAQRFQLPGVALADYPGGRLGGNWATILYPMGRNLPRIVAAEVPPLGGGGRCLAGLARLLPIGQHVGMELTYPREAETFRLEVRRWLEANLPEGWFRPGPMGTLERNEDFELAGAEREAFNKAWTPKLFEGGWICATWPAEYGGRGLSAVGGPGPHRGIPPGRCPDAGRLLRRHAGRADHSAMGHRGAEEDVPSPDPVGKGRSWCQGFSEPNSGSDLASLKTTAVLDGDEWIVNGQKVWTTQAQNADYVFLLARTDPDAPCTRASPICWCPCASPASRFGPSSRSTGPPSSTRSSSTTPAVPATPWSAVSTTAGRWP